MRRIRPEQWPLIAAVTVLLISGGALLFYLLFQKPPAAAPGAPPASPAAVKTLSALAPEPVWESLERFADSMTPKEFQEAMERVYGDGSPAWQDLFTIADAPGGHPGLQIVRWSAVPAAPHLSLSLQGSRPPQRYWREAAELPPSTAPADRPLEGVSIALDPGHIGGAWARMEQRWYQPPDESTAVMEGEMTLRTAQLLKPALEALGARVSLVRDATEPVTATRPADYGALTTTSQQAELFFYRKAEIRARADKVNQQLRPDLVVCLHFNAEPWGEPGKVTFVDANHLHLIVNGHYGPDEMGLDDVRHEMLERVFQRSEREELRLADAVAKSLAAATGLPPYDYAAGHMAANAHRPIPDNPYVWARNLMANRLYQCPVVFTEPYVMNNRDVYDRVAAGDYEGERLVAGKLRKSLYREYADAVAAGLKAHYTAHRRAE